VDDVQRIRDTAEAAHRRTDAVETRLAVLESHHVDLRTDVKAMGKQQDEHSRSLATISADVKHMSRSVEEILRSMGGRVALGATGGGVIAAVAYVVMEMMRP
jgi:uncharacterized protein YoxC